MEKIKMPKIKGYAYKAVALCTECCTNYKENLNIEIKVPAFISKKHIELNNNANDYLKNLKQIQKYFIEKLNIDTGQPKFTKQDFHNKPNKKLLFHFYCIFNTINIYKTDNELILESALFAYPEITGQIKEQCFQKVSMKPQTIEDEYYTFKLDSNFINEIENNSFFGSWKISCDNANCTVDSICDIKNIENLFKDTCYKDFSVPGFLPEFLLKLLYFKLCPRQY